MSFTPEDIRAVTFKRSAIGKRGYDEGEVDSFLETVEAELARLIQQVQTLSRQPRGILESPVGDVTAHADDHIRAVGILQAAEITASRLTQEAAAECERSLEVARHRSASLIAEATKRAAAIDEDSSFAASQLEKESKARNDEIFGALLQNRDALEREIARLATQRAQLNEQLYGVIGKHVALLEQDNTMYQRPSLVGDISADQAVGIVELATASSTGKNVPLR